MSKLISAALIATAQSARYPNAAQPGVLDDVSASATPIPSVQAAEVRGFASVAGSLRWVKAQDHFFQGGELIQSGDFVQVSDEDSKRLVASGRAAAASDDEVAAASKPQPKAGK